MLIINPYSLCKIYAITSESRPDLVYYGHTIETLDERFSGHNCKSNNCSSYQIIKLGDAYISLVEDYPCKNHDEASAREAYYIANFRCVNSNISNSKISKRKNLKLQKLQETKENITKLLRQYSNRETFDTLNNILLKDQQLLNDFIDEFTINFKYYKLKRLEYLNIFTKFQIRSYMLFNEIYNNESNRIILENYLINTSFYNHLEYFLIYNTYLYFLNKYMIVIYNYQLYSDNITTILNNWINNLDIYILKTIKSYTKKILNNAKICLHKLKNYNILDDKKCRLVLNIIKDLYDYLYINNRYIYKETMQLFNYQSLII